MRHKTLAALAALGLAAVTVGTATTASAADEDGAATVEHRTRVLTDVPQVSVGTAVTSSVGTATRISGANRYETAVAISTANWEPDFTSTVFLASGTSTADALALGASTLLMGPILLTDRDRLPEVTRAELARLHPCQVVVVGGPAAVSDAVVAEAGGYADATGCDLPE